MPALSTYGAGSLGGFGHAKTPPPFNFNIAGGTSVNLRTAALAAGWDGAGNVRATVTANIGAANTGTPALTVNGSFPQGATLTINSGVYVAGAGGSVTNNYGGAGGPALLVTVPLIVTNNGILGGGGGAGGSNDIGWVGGAGAGLPAGTGSGSTAPTLTNGGNSTLGMVGGVAGSPGGVGRAAGGGGLGGAGGNATNYTTAGGPTDPTVGDSDPVPGDTYAGYPGGAAGAAVQGNNNVTWLSVGTRYGALNP